MQPELTPSVENYLETIFLLSREQRVVRVRDIAKTMDVSMPSVNNALKNLKKKELVKQERYGDIEITSEGEKIAGKIYGTHKALVVFFKDILNTDEKVAEEDACAIEHYISPKTLARLVKFIRFFETCPVQDIPTWKKGFELYCARGERPEKCEKCVKNA